MPASKSGSDIRATTVRRDIFLRDQRKASGLSARQLREAGCHGLKHVRLVTGDEIRGMFPLLRGDDIVGGSFCSTDGFVDPYSAMIGFMTWAGDHGATLWKNAGVTGIKRNVEGGSFEVATTRDTVSTRTVVDCAGPWAAQIARWWASICRRTVASHAGPTEPLTSFRTPRL